MDLDKEAAEEDNKNSDFVQPAAGNMWDNIKANDDNDDDMPAILRRRKKNKD